MKRILMAMVVVITAGCASTSEPSGPWAASVKYDRFTDDVDCFVSTGDYFTASGVYTSNNRFYPFVQKKDGKLLVGVRSGGAQKIPVGDVKFRIDSNKAWEIKTSETPTDKSAESGQPALLPYMANLPEEQKKLIQDSYSGAMKNYVAMMSPYTVATGEKAEKILAEMKRGRKVIYQAGMFGPIDMAKSTVGEIEINGSFLKALEQCNVI